MQVGKQLVLTFKYLFCFVCMYVCVPWVPDVCRDQRKVPAFLELEVQMVRSRHVGAGN